MSRCHRVQRVCRTPVIRRGSSLQRCATATVIPSIRVTTDIIHALQRCCICSVFTWCYVKELGRLRGKYRPAVFFIPRPCPLSVCAVLALVILSDKSITVVGIRPILPSSLIYTVILADDTCACIKASTLVVLTQGICTCITLIHNIFRNSSFEQLVSNRTDSPMSGRIEFYTVLAIDTPIVAGITIIEHTSCRKRNLMRILRSALPVKVIDIVSVLIIVTVTEIKIIIVRGGKHTRITYIVVMETGVIALTCYGIVRYIAERRTRRAVHCTYETGIERVLRPRYCGVVTRRVHRAYYATHIEVHSVYIRRSIIILTVVNTHRHYVNINIRRHIVYLSAVTQITKRTAVIRTLHTADYTTDIEPPSVIAADDDKLLPNGTGLTRSRVNIRSIYGTVLHVNITYL